MYWKITRDILDEGTSDSQKGRERGKRKEGEKMVRFVLKDDDDVTYYMGIISASAADSEAVFAPLDRAMHWAGCTRLYVNGEMV